MINIYFDVAQDEVDIYLNFSRVRSFIKFVFQGEGDIKFCNSSNKGRKFSNKIYNEVGEGFKKIIFA